MNTLSWIGLCFLVFNTFFLIIVMVGYIRRQWKYVDEEMAKSKAEEDAFKERVRQADQLLDTIFHNKKSLR